MDDVVGAASAESFEHVLHRAEVERDEVVRRDVFRERTLNPVIERRAEMARSHDDVRSEQFVVLDGERGGDALGASPRFVGHVALLIEQPRRLVLFPIPSLKLS